MKLRKKTALVAGATRGIGLAIARGLAAEGVRLVLPWHDDWPDDAKTLQDEFGDTGGNHILVRADLRERQDVDKVAVAAEKKAGALHILINNIERGGMPIVHGSYERSINRDQWQLELDTTLLAKRLIFESCLPLMQKTGQASVINISSIAAITGRSGPAGLLYSDGYAAANRAIASLTETWARISAPSVRVNEIMLGIFDTRHGRDTRGWQALSTAQKKKLLDHTLLGRTGSPGEVVDTVLFLLQKAEYMTGTTIRLDGGYVLGGEKALPVPDGIL
ncbi:MAG: SDR family oxidoreductase [Desulfobulbaceae bacterium]|nr:SDR family oxidoreductase [Desulfobulbaceae bacterium]